MTLKKRFVVWNKVPNKCCPMHDWPWHFVGLVKDLADAYSRDCVGKTHFRCVTLDKMYQVRVHDLYKSMCKAYVAYRNKNRNAIMRSFHDRALELYKNVIAYASADPLYKPTFKVNAKAARWINTIDKKFSLNTNAQLDPF